MQFIPSMLHITTKGLPRVMARADMSVVSALKARTRRALCSVLAAAIAVASPAGPPPTTAICIVLLKVPNYVGTI